MSGGSALSCRRDGRHLVFEDQLVLIVGASQLVGAFRFSRTEMWQIYVITHFFPITKREQIDSSRLVPLAYVHTDSVAFSRRL